MSHRERFSRWRVRTAFEDISEALLPFVARIAWVGSWRRGCATLGDADLLVIPDRKGFASAVEDLLDPIEERGLECAFGWFGSLMVNVFTTSPGDWGAALQWTTGSRDHNVAVRAYARRRGLLANQYGVFIRRGKGPKVPGSSETEAGFYRAIGLRWVRPEVRDRRTPRFGVFPMNGGPGSRPSKTPARPSSPSSVPTYIPLFTEIGALAAAELDAHPNRPPDAPGHRATGGPRFVSPAGEPQPADQRTARRP